MFHVAIIVAFDYWAGFYAPSPPNPPVCLLSETHASRNEERRAVEGHGGYSRLQDGRIGEQRELSSAARLDDLSLFISLSPSWLTLPFIIRCIPYILDVSL